MNHSPKTVPKKAALEDFNFQGSRGALIFTGNHPVVEPLFSTDKVGTLLKMPLKKKKTLWPLFMDEVQLPQG